MNQNQHLERFCGNVVDSIMLLYSKNLTDQLLIILYSSIDTLGLLDAKDDQKKATEETFKNWANKYLTYDVTFDFNAEDLWRARCLALHAPELTTDENQTIKGRKLKYVSGPSEDIFVKAFMEATAGVDEGLHVPVNIDDFVVFFLDAVLKFCKDYELKVSSHQVSINRAEV